MKYVFASLGMVGALGACVVAEAEDTTAVALTGTRCDLWGCGANSASVGDGILFDELDWSGRELNKSGTVILGAYSQYGTPVQLRVERHELYAVALDGSREYHNSDLLGTIVKLKHPTATFELRIDGVDQQSLEFWSGVTEAVPSYLIRARTTSNDGFKELICKNNVVGEDPRWASAPNNAIAFQWDRYDAPSKTVYADPSSTWFNLACAGTTPAKLHLQRHTEAGAYLANGKRAYPTSLAQRQTLLKMFTADFCGNGTSYTADGTPLWYLNASGTMSNAFVWPTPTRATGEAIWNAWGAVCLDTPRRDPWNRNMIDCASVLPSCGTMGGWGANGYIASGIPSTVPIPSTVLMAWPPSP